MPPKPRFFQYRTPEYATFADISTTPWECVRGMDRGFGYNRASVEADFLTRDELLRSIVDIAAKGGNLLLNVGPRHDGQIPDEQLTRLGWLAERADAHGASVAGTRPWARAEGRSPEGHDVRYTAHRDTVWAHLWLADGSASSAPSPTITLPFRTTPATTVTDAAGKALVFRGDERSTTIEVPAEVDDAVFTVGLHQLEAAAE